MKIYKRDYWFKQIKDAWTDLSLIWLSGVRRTGKTVLCKSIKGVEYFDCELPRIRQEMSDPEKFLSAHRKQHIVLDEIHRLDNPSELLKIAADHYPDIKIIATGSSSLGASKKFKDTLTGRKTNIWITPMIYDDMKDFGNTDIKHRILHGGLPHMFSAKKIKEQEYQEWFDSFWAKDIQELFRLAQRQSFEKFFELLIINNGGMYEATNYARPCEVNRGTISNYLKVFEATYVATIVKPFNSFKSSEITSAPKVYMFDTGFVCYYKGIYEVSNLNSAILWETLVLNELAAITQKRKIYYWRDKRLHEVDFVIPHRNGDITAIECKWSSKSFNSGNLAIFRNKYPNGKNLVACTDVNKSYKKNYGKLEVEYVGLRDIGKIILGQEY